MRLKTIVRTSSTASTAVAPSWNALDAAPLRHTAPPPAPPASPERPRGETVGEYLGRRTGVAEAQRLMDDAAQAHGAQEGFHVTLGRGLHRLRERVRDDVAIEGVAEHRAHEHRHGDVDIGSIVRSSLVHRGATIQVDKAAIEQHAVAQPFVQKFIEEGATVRKLIVVPNKLVNIVVG